MRYAVVENGIVSNIVIWDGENDIFADFVTVEITDEMIVAQGYKYLEGNFIPPVEPAKSKDELIQDASLKIAYLLSLATSKIVIWQTKLLAGRELPPADSAMLNAWLDYIDVLEALDLSNAPEIDWPVTPS